MGESKVGNEITNGKRLRNKIVVQHFIHEKSGTVVFQDHDEATNEPLLEEDHQHTANKYFSLRLFTYAKAYCETVVQNGQVSDRFQRKFILFKNQ